MTRLVALAAAFISGGTVGLLVGALLGAASATDRTWVEDDIRENGWSDTAERGEG